MRVAIVHYWFVTRRGGERVVEALCELFPQADLFALVADCKTLSPELQKHKLTTSFLQSYREAGNGTGTCSRCIRWRWSNSICEATTW